MFQIHNRILPTSTGAIFTSYLIRFSMSKSSISALVKRCEYQSMTLFRTVLPLTSSKPASFLFKTNEMQETVSTINSNLRVLKEAGISSKVTAVVTKQGHSRYFMKNSKPMCLEDFTDDVELLNKERVFQEKSLKNDFGSTGFPAEQSTSERSEGDFRELITFLPHHAESGYLFLRTSP